MSLINTFLQASSVLMNSQNSQWQRERENERGQTALEIEGIRQEHQLKMVYLTQEFQKNSRWEEANLRTIDQRQYQENEYLLRAHQQRLERMKVSYYTPTKWVGTRLPHAPAPFVIVSLNPHQEHNPFKTEVVRIAPFSRIAHRLKERNQEHINRLFSVVTTQEGFSSDDEVLDFYNRELNCPCIVIYGEFTGASFVVNALYAGMEQNQIKFDKDRPSSLGAKVVRVWEVSYKTIDSLKQSYAQKGDKYGWLEALETYTETHVGLFVQLMLDNLFSYSPRHVYEVKAPLFLQEKEEELTRLGIWEALKTSLLERYEVLKGRQEEKTNPIIYISKTNSTGEFIDCNFKSITQKSNGSWWCKTANGHNRQIFTFEETIGSPIFYNGYLKIKKNQKYGYLNHEGKIVIDCQFDSVSDKVMNDRAEVKINNLSTVINMEGEQDVPAINGYHVIYSDFVITCENQGKQQVYCGKRLCFENSNGIKFIEGLFGHKIVAKKKGLLGVINTDGKVVLPFEYESIQYINLVYASYPFAINRCSVVKKNNGNYFLWIFDEMLQQRRDYVGEMIELNNEIESCLKYGDIAYNYFEIDMNFPMKTDDKHEFFIKVLTDFDYYYLLVTFNGVVNLCYYSNEFFVINPPKIVENLILTSKANKKNMLSYGFIEPRLYQGYMNKDVSITDEEGFDVSIEYTMKIPMMYDDAKPFSLGLAAVCLNSKWGYINEYNKTIMPFIFDDALSFYDGAAPVMKKSFLGKMQWGVINSKGAELVPNIFAEITAFSDGCACATFDKKESTERCWFVLNKEGKILVM